MVEGVELLESVVTAKMGNTGIKQETSQQMEPVSERFFLFSSLVSLSPSFEVQISPEKGQGNTDTSCTVERPLQAYRQDLVQSSLSCSSGEGPRGKYFAESRRYERLSNSGNTRIKACHV